MQAYIVVSLLTGTRTEELRALTWSHVDLDGELPRRAVVAIGARGRGHQDATVAAHPRAPKGLRNRTSSPQTVANTKSHAQRSTMARQ